MTFDTAVIGAGLFGATIARALVALGRSVVVFDDGRPLSGSAPSGSLMKPSWFGGLGKEVHEPSLETLEDIYGITELGFRVWPLNVVQKVLWIPTSRILDRGDLEMRTLQVRQVLPPHAGDRRTGVAWQGEDRVEVQMFHLVVIAAGIWTNLLSPVPKLEGKQGVSFSWEGQVENFIRPWAPYKQAVAFNDSPTTAWAGDGSAIKPSNWTIQREAASFKRMSEYCDFNKLRSTVHFKTGIRPYVPLAKPCLLEQRARGLWVATGGAKNGLVAAGWCAHEIARQST